MHPICLYLLTDYELSKLFIHTSQFWCKFNKFISFSHHFSWKTYVKSRNNPVYIPSPNPLFGISFTNSQLIHTLIHIVFHTSFRCLWHLHVFFF